MFMRVNSLFPTFVLNLCVSFSCLAQGEGGTADRVEKGKQFLKKIRNSWLNCLELAPYKVGKMTIRSDRLVENWYSRGHSLGIVYHFNGSKELSIFNPTYTSVIRIDGDKLGLTYVAPTRNPDKFPDTFLLALSCTPEGTLVTAALDHNRIEIADFDFSEKHHFIKFVPRVPTVDWESLELRFSEQTRPLPDKRIVKYIDGSYELATHDDFKEIGGFLLPGKIGSKKSKSDALIFTDEANEFFNYEYVPEDKLDEARCYHRYYGIPEPDFGKVADFTPRRWSAWLIFLISVSGVGLAILYYWRRSSYVAR
jgi:hypothetical protein